MEMAFSGDDGDDNMLSQMLDLFESTPNIDGSGDISSGDELCSQALDNVISLQDFSSGDEICSQALENSVNELAQFSSGDEMCSQALDNVTFNVEFNRDGAQMTYGHRNDCYDAISEDEEDRSMVITQNSFRDVQDISSDEGTILARDDCNNAGMIWFGPDIGYTKVCMGNVVDITHMEEDDGSTLVRGFASQCIDYDENDGKEHPPIEPDQQWTCNVLPSMAKPPLDCSYEDSEDISCQEPIPMGGMLVEGISTSEMLAGARTVIMGPSTSHDARQKLIQPTTSASNSTPQNVMEPRSPTPPPSENQNSHGAQESNVHQNYIAPVGYMEQYMCTSNVEKLGETDPYHVDLPPMVKPRRRFAFSRDFMDEKTLTKSLIPPRTQMKGQWAYRAFKQWQSDRLSVDSDFPQIDIVNMPLPMMNEYMSLFIREVRKQDGEKYPPKSIYQIVCGIQKHLELNCVQVKFLQDPVFNLLRKTTDFEMQTAAAEGLGLNTKQADPISVKQEEVLWQKGVLGSNNPRSLQYAVFWLIGLCFGLRSGDDHRNLRVQNFSFKKDGEGEEYLLYEECVSKTYKGGLKDKSFKPRVARAYSNKIDPTRCIVTLIKKYMNLCPVKAFDKAFYMKALTKLKAEQWYSLQAIGHNTLSKYVANIMCEAGFGPEDGFFTNHSLRASLATRLFENQVDEQLIMNQTGHRSNEAVRRYKRPSDSLLQVVSAKCQKVSTISVPPVSIVPSSQSMESDMSVKQSTSSSSMNVPNVALELTTSSGNMNVPKVDLQLTTSSQDMNVQKVTLDSELHMKKENELTVLVEKKPNAMITNPTDSDENKSTIINVYGGAPVFHFK